MNGFPHSDTVEFYEIPDCDSFFCGISLQKAGPMKTVLHSKNRAAFFEGLGIDPHQVIAPNQIHSKEVYCADLDYLVSEPVSCDGLITTNPDLILSVTVADCMAIWIVDPVSKCFGLLHSGWKGTGILKNALEKAMYEYNASVNDIRMIFGPHIRSCCYTVDKERALNFSKEFGPSCVHYDQSLEKDNFPWTYRLSLATANRLMCESLGIAVKNIIEVPFCTCCDARYGSNRREGADSFTHMLAFVGCH